MQESKSVKSRKSKEFDSQKTIQYCQLNGQIELLTDRPEAAALIVNLTNDKQ